MFQLLRPQPEVRLFGSNDKSKKFNDDVICVTVDNFSGLSEIFLEIAIEMRGEKKSQ